MNQKIQGFSILESLQVSLRVWVNGSSYELLKQGNLHTNFSVREKSWLYRTDDRMQLLCVEYSNSELDTQVTEK